MKKVSFAMDVRLSDWKQLFNVSEMDKVVKDTYAIHFLSECKRISMCMCVCLLYGLSPHHVSMKHRAMLSGVLYSW